MPSQNWLQNDSKKGIPFCGKLFLPHIFGGVCFSQNIWTSTLTMKFMTWTRQPPKVAIVEDKWWGGSESIRTAQALADHWWALPMSVIRDLKIGVSRPKRWDVHENEEFSELSAVELFRWNHQKLGVADTDVSKQRLLLVAQKDVEDEYWWNLEIPVKLGRITKLQSSFKERIWRAHIDPKNKQFAPARRPKKRPKKEGNLFQLRTVSFREGYWFLISYLLNVILSWNDSNHLIFLKWLWLFVWFMPKAYQKQKN